MRKQFLLLMLIVLIINSGCKKNPIAKLLLKEELQKSLDKHLAQTKGKHPWQDYWIWALYKKYRQKSLPGSICLVRFSQRVWKKYSF
jgi:uncharacterized membrane protein YhaH (DUF805 family)